MSSTVHEKRTDEGRPLTATVEQSAVLSANRRRKRPLPATRQEADALYGPSARIAPKPATVPRLARLAQLGLIPRYTNAEAHALILDAMYDEQGNLRLDPTIQAVQAKPVP